MGSEGMMSTMASSSCCDNCMEQALTFLMRTISVSAHGDCLDPRGEEREYVSVYKTSYLFATHLLHQKTRFMMVMIFLQLLIYVLIVWYYNIVSMH